MNKRTSSRGKRFKNAQDDKSPPTLGPQIPHLPSFDEEDPKEKRTNRPTKNTGMTLHNRGISGREAGHRSTDPSLPEPRDDEPRHRHPHRNPDVTMENVHRLTAYRLRRELKRRGYFLETTTTTTATDTDAATTDPTDPEHDERRTPPIVNYRVLLETTVRLLERDGVERERKRMAELVSDREGGGDVDGGDGGGESLKERMAREREERKAAAVERSRLRQAEEGYFARKKVQVVVDAKGGGGGGIGEGRDDDRQEEVEEEDDEEVDECGVKTDNPFAPRFRSKIGGRYV